MRSAIEKHNRGISEEEEEKHNRSTTEAYQRRADIVPWSQHFYRVLHQRRYTIPMWTFNTFTRPRFICDIQLQHWDQGGYTLYIIQFWYRINHFWSPWRTSFGAIKNIQNSLSAVCQWRTIGTYLESYRDTELNAFQLRSLSFASWYSLFTTMFNFLLVLLPYLNA